MQEQEVPMEHATKQFRKRNAILSCLRSTTSHPSAEMVHDMLQTNHPDISLASAPCVCGSVRSWLCSSMKQTW